MKHRTRTRIEQAVDDLQTALVDEAMRQCEERNPYAVSMVMQECNRLRSMLRRFTFIQE